MREGRVESERKRECERGLERVGECRRVLAGRGRQAGRQSGWVERSWVVRKGESERGRGREGGSPRVVTVRQN